MNGIVKINVPFGFKILKHSDMNADGSGKCSKTWNATTVSELQSFRGSGLFRSAKTSTRL
jgi:hypothetical protein